MNEKKRLSISVMIGGALSYFTREMIRGIAEQAKQENMNTYFFLRTHTKPFFRSVLGDFGNNIYDYQFNTINDYSRICGVDGTIIGYGTIGFHLQKDDSMAFAARYNSKPVVFLTEELDLPNCHCIISDNYQGMFDAIEHLIVVDGCRKILFMRGPERNTDAIERLRGYRAAMEKHGLPVTDSMIGIGDFSVYVDDEVQRLLDANPDAEAFAFSNDEMASSCYRVCKARGLRIGQDLKITGFDSGDFAEKLIPPLTSVLQDSYQMGAQAVTDIRRIIDGETLPHTRFPVMLVPRESCGCPPNRGREEDNDRDWAGEVERLRLEASRREAVFREYQGKSWYIPMMARDLNESMGNEVEFCSQVVEELRLMKVNAAYLFLLDHSLSYDGKSEWECPDNLYLASYCRGGKTFTYQPYDRPQVTAENGIAQLTDDGELHQFMVLLLFSGDRQYGLLVCDVPTEELSFFYILSLQLGLSLNYYELNRIQEMNRRQLAQDMEAIRARNLELDKLSGYDQLTGLLNLRGLTGRVKLLAESGTAPNAYVIYCDLDHLKQINDYFGHPEGNFAITSCASILKGCIRETDTVARTGGDEFICLVTSDDPDFPKRFRECLIASCAEVNRTSAKPFYVGLSVGIQPFTLRSYTDFQEAVAKADKLLYEAKKNRRRDVRRKIAE